MQQRDPCTGLFVQELSNHAQLSLVRFDARLCVL